MKLPESRIAPSLLSCDFARLADEIAGIEAAGADWLHVDVMDGHFVPNLTLGPPVVEAIAKVARRPLDVHLMITEPAKWATHYAEAGAHVLTFHYEAVDGVQGARETVRAFRAAGVAQVGVSVKPATPVEALAPLLDALDLVLVMSVEPGFGGQKFMPEVLAKVRWLRAQGFEREVEMDGGIGEDTLPACAEAGANVFVAGSAIFRSRDRAATIRRLRESAERARATTPRLTGHT